MTEQELLWNIVKVGVPIIAIVTPLLKLNSSIVRLIDRLDAISKHNDLQDSRINKHSQEIDTHSVTLANQLEK